MNSTAGRGWAESWGRWWSAKDDVERITFYTRHSFSGLVAIGPLVVFGRVTDPDVLGVRPVAGVAALVLSVLQAVVVGLVLGRLVTRGHVPRSSRVPLVLTSAAAFCAGFAMPSPQGGGLVRVAAVVVLFWPAGFLGARRSGALALLAGTVLIALNREAFEWPGQVLLAGLVLAVVCWFAAVTVRLSMWILDVVRRLASAERDRARLAVAEERLRFARDLHDVVGRDLSAIAVTSDLVAELARRGRPEAVDRAEEVRRIAQESLREVREVVRGYRGVDLDVELEGAAALLRSAGVECTVTADAAGASEAARTAAAWVVREGVTNVVRHSSSATRCRIEVSGGGGGPVRVLIENDGAPQTVPGSGSGLVGLAERLRPLGGELTTERREGTFALRVELPVVSA
ncbi:sensor histidine kinase [Kineococcus auxinigenes]|uniref:sensor histidine kinase n=1 Tax=unclassified Kineococcus TaxID=2621656 RepID=UPI003D7D9626